MTLIDRYLTARIVASLIRSILAISLLFIFIDLATHRRSEILQNDVPARIVAEYYLVLLPSMLRDFQIAAVATLVTYLLVLGKAAQDRETTALLASGVSVYRFLRFPVLVGLLCSFGVFAVSETVGVPAAKRVVEIEDHFFSKSSGHPSMPVSWANLDGGWTCHIFSFDRDTMSGEDVLMLKLGEDRVEQVEADAIVWDGVQERWMLEGGMWSVFYPEHGMEVESRTIAIEPAPIVEDPTALFLSDSDSAARTLTELRNQIEVAQHRRVPTHRTEVDYHGRFAAPALSFIMMWIAMPFALRQNRGGLAFSLAGSAGICLAYFVVYAAAIGLGNIGRIEPWIAAWFANLLFGVAAVVLMRQTPT